ncbi:ubiquitin carboxyl-terminal hydrolase 24 [Limosa lapponica baueri]|uniref:Ubiquitin carboxyl-terminal hydrolase 24 n=1 Tax=Limosa lapponica baueri TaxID=1758121 RepID=A0A2I0T6Z1_LIMLA|nr:ubiquitin carboxyl-terminal hydrolase 24 [Limosa lapponica baueri]
MYALRELTGSLSVLIEMVVYCCFCNEHFSFTVLHFIKTQLETAPPHELKNIFQLLHEILDTLAYATALLNEKDQSGSSNGSESSPANENGERHLQQGSESPMMIGEPKSDLDDVDP